MGKIVEDSAETRDLLEQIHSGRTEAFNRLFDRHRWALRQMVGRRMNPALAPRVDPSDVMQEVQLDAMKYLDSYLRRRPMPFRLWLLKTTHQRLVKIERFHLIAARRSLRREVLLSDQSSFALAKRFAADGATPSEMASRKETARQVRTALAALSERDREVIVLRNFDYLSNREVSCVLEISVGAAKKRYARALLRLKDLLQEFGITGDSP